MQNPNLSPQMPCFVSTRAAAHRMRSRLLWRGPRCDSDVPAVQGIAGPIPMAAVHAGKGSSWEVLFFPSTFVPGPPLQQERGFASRPALSPQGSPEMRAWHSAEQSSVQWVQVGARGGALSCGYGPHLLGTAAGGAAFGRFGSGPSAQSCTGHKAAPPHVLLCTALTALSHIRLLFPQTTPIIPEGLFDPTAAGLAPTTPHIITQTQHPKANTLPQPHQCPHTRRPLSGRGRSGTRKWCRATPPRHFLPAPCSCEGSTVLGWGGSTQGTHGGTPRPAHGQ